jgi:hypothetical protein
VHPTTTAGSSSVGRRPVLTTAAAPPTVPFRTTKQQLRRQYSHHHTKLHLKKDGTNRGAIILGVVLLACVWIFSIPPEFRRAYLCGSERCIEDRQAYLCNDCMTTDEWRTGIINYYKSGGGIKFDFSIDPNSKMKL